MEKLKIAIADDNERMVRLLGKIVESDDELNVVGTAKDGEEAYEIIKNKQPDVVLLDIVMPKLDGLGVMDKVNKDTTLKKRPAFIMISAIGQEKITEDAFDLGADYFIMKPFETCKGENANEAIYHESGWRMEPVSAKGRTACQRSDPFGRTGDGGRCRSGTRRLGIGLCPSGFIGRPL